MSAAAPAAEIDTDLYSRQLYVLGMEAMQRMRQSNVLIVGLSGLGVEVAKNVILAGVRSVTLHDEAPARASDLAAQFYLSETDIGKPRAAQCIAALRELNQYTPVSLLDGALAPSEECVGRFQVVVMIDQPLAQLDAIGRFCHERGIRFIAAGGAWGTSRRLARAPRQPPRARIQLSATHRVCQLAHPLVSPRPAPHRTAPRRDAPPPAFGLAGFAFSDFGEEFTVFDPDDLAPRTGVVVDISAEAAAVVTVAEHTPHGLYSGDHVQLEGVEGMEALGERPAVPVTVLDPLRFRVPLDTTAMPRYLRGGYFKQVKQPLRLSYRSFPESVLAPEAHLANFHDPARAAKLHALLRALWQFQAAHGGDAPAPGDAAHADEVVRAAQALAPDAVASDADAALLRRLALVAGGQLGAVAAFFGGVVGQEVLKVCAREGEGERELGILGSPSDR